MDRALDLPKPSADMLQNSKRACYLLLATLAIYVGSYLTLSRVGFRNADQVGAKGFYYVTPVGQLTRSVNTALCVLYYPLSGIDTWLGTGRAVASDPIAL
jgi:hypothetical protein